MHDLLTTVSRAALAAGLVAAVATAAMPSARAQEPAPERGEVVFDRDRPDFDAKGLPLDGFRLYPAIEVVGAYDDNVFATDTNEQEDFLTIISPMIDLESQWSRHELNLAAYADIERYADNDSEDAEEYGIGFDGRLDVTARDEIRADARYDRRVEGRTDPDQGGGDRNEVDDIFFGLGYTHEFNRISVAFDASYRDLDFIGDALRLRDRVVYEAQARVTYDVSPRFDVFVEPFYIYREYDVSRTPAGIEQDFETFGLLGGTTIDLTGVLVGEIGLGVFQDEFEEPTRDSVTGFALEIELDWNVTELTSIRARASNESEATTVGGASNLVTTLAGLEVQHELMRNVLIGADAYVQREDFDGISRTDDTYGAGLEVQYLVNRYFSVFAEYDHETQESDVAAADYAINVVMVGIRGQF